LTRQFLAKMRITTAPLQRRRLRIPSSSHYVKERFGE
jgi:hypothetical protein